jgi:hypothetical protein
MIDQYSQVLDLKQTALLVHSLISECSLWIPLFYRMTHLGGERLGGWNRSSAEYLQLGCSETSSSRVHVTISLRSFHRFARF